MSMEGGMLSEYLYFVFSNWRQGLEGRGPWRAPPGPTFRIFQDILGHQDFSTKSKKTCPIFFCRQGHTRALGPKNIYEIICAPKCFLYFGYVKTIKHFQCIMFSVEGSLLINIK